MRALWVAGRGSRALVAPLMLAAVLAGVGPGTASASACLAGTGQPVRPGSSNGFSAVAVSSCQAWAVGDYTASTGGPRTLIERWNGTAWKRQPSPSPGSSNNTLSGVAATSASNAWAVGQDSNNAASSVFQTLAEHWNGTAWTRVPSPSPGTGNNDLIGVAATSASDAWAVGLYDSGPGTPFQTLAEHWNGTAWTRVPTPNPGGGILKSVAATSASNAWAVGSYSSGAGGSLTLIEHWNGTTWTQVPSPSPGPPGRLNELSGVAALSSTDAWAVGQYFSRTTFADQTLIERWNGTTWTQVPSPNPSPFTDDGLFAVVATSASDAWAVGDYTSNNHPFPDLTLIERWNGTAWTQVPSPNPSSSENGFGGVAATSPANVWAVGAYGVGSQGQTPQALAFHCC